MHLPGAWIGKKNRAARRAARIAIEPLEDRRLLSTIPAAQLDPVQPYPGLLQGLGTMLSGSEHGSYLRTFEESGSNADWRVALTVTISSSFSISDGYLQETLTTTYTLRDSPYIAGPLTPVEVARPQFPMGRR